VKEQKGNDQRSKLLNEVNAPQNKSLYLYYLKGYKLSTLINLLVDANLLEPKVFVHPQ